VANTHVAAEPNGTHEQDRATCNAIGAAGAAPIQPTRMAAELNNPHSSDMPPEIGNPIIISFRINAQSACQNRPRTRNFRNGLHAQQIRIAAPHIRTFTTVVEFTGTAGLSKGANPTAGLASDGGD
jgi:hypothetical protein